MSYEVHKQEKVFRIGSESSNAAVALSHDLESLDESLVSGINQQFDSLSVFKSQLAHLKELHYRLSFLMGEVKEVIIK